MMKPFLHIIRWPNLLMVVGIQAILFIRLLHREASVLEAGDMALICVITMLIAASGYVINDYYDMHIDSINRPRRWIAGNTWPVNRVIRLYFTLLAAGAFLSFILAFRLGLMLYIWIYPLAILGIWYYSFALKCKPVIGNLWVAIFCGGVIGIVAMPDLILNNTGVIRPELWYYAVFAFLSTWYREIVKDLEDEKGDREMSCNTFVVRYGLRAGKVMALALGLCLLLSLIWWDVANGQGTVELILMVVQGSIVASMAFIWWARDLSYFHHASTVIKIIMLGGTLILFVIQ